MSWDVKLQAPAALHAPETSIWEEFQQCQVRGVLTLPVQGRSSIASTRRTAEVGVAKQGAQVVVQKPPALLHKVHRWRVEEDALRRQPQPAIRDSEGRECACRSFHQHQQQRPIVTVISDITAKCESPVDHTLVGWRPTQRPVQRLEVPESPRDRPLRMWMP